MSILIMGMDMPIKGSCTVTIHSDGRVTVTPTRPLRHGFVVGKAVEIPKHGRLIDADVLKNAIDKYEMIHGLLKYDFAASAPTIVEGEEE